MQCIYFFCFCPLEYPGTYPKNMSTLMCPFDQDNSLYNSQDTETNEVLIDYFTSVWLDSIWNRIPVSFKKNDKIKIYDLRQLG